MNIKKTSAIIGLFFVGLIVTFIMLRAPSRPSVDARPIHLVISGPDGQLYSGSYVADGVTSHVSDIRPGRISFMARDVMYEFKRQEGEGKFRVDLLVGELPRLTTSSGNREGIRGWLNYTGSTERYSAETF